MFYGSQEAIRQQGDASLILNANGSSVKGCTASPLPNAGLEADRRGSFATARTYLVGACTLPLQDLLSQTHYQNIATFG